MGSERQFPVPLNVTLLDVRTDGAGRLPGAPLRRIRTFEQRGEPAILSEAVANPDRQPSPARVRRQSVKVRSSLLRLISTADRASHIAAAGLKQSNVHLCLGIG